MAGIALLLMLAPMAVAFISLAVTPVAAQELEAEVTVKAPEYVKEGKTFNVTIDVDSITDFNSGVFDLSFDPGILKVKEVTSGNIGNMEIPITKWDYMDSETIKVMFELPEDTTVSGSGYLAGITFKVTGKKGAKSELKIANGELIKFVFSEGRAEPEEIPANWHDTEIRIGIEEEGPEPTPATSPIPIPTATPKPAGFEAIFVIAVTFTVVYILQRRIEKR